MADRGLLDGKVAVVYGGGGAIGGAAAREFAREGAMVFVAGRTLRALEAVVDEIRSAGGQAEAGAVDAMDEESVDSHLDRVLAVGGRIDVALNAIGVAHVQGTPFGELSLDAFCHPIDRYTRANFITARAVARPMRARRSGVILTLSTPGSRMAGTGYLGYGVTCAAIEAFSRILAGELGTFGIRVICLRSDVIPEALASSHSRRVFEGFARRAGRTVEELIEERQRTGTLLGRFPSLREVAWFATFAASERAGAMTGAIANLTCGSLVD